MSHVPLCWFVFTVHNVWLSSSCWWPGLTLLTCNRGRQSVSQMPEQRMQQMGSPFLVTTTRGFTTNIKHNQVTLKSAQPGGPYIQLNQRASNSTQPGGLKFYTTRGPHILHNQGASNSTQPWGNKKVSQSTQQGALLTKGFTFFKLFHFWSISRICNKILLDQPVPCKSFGISGNSTSLIESFMFQSS